MVKLAKLLGAILACVALPSCVGMYSNTERFLNPPAEGANEIDVIRQFGKPSYSSTVEDQTVYVYQVRDVKYLLVAGLYKGHDLVVVCRDGRVHESKKIPRSKSFSLFQPANWAIEQ